jgi:hypothetical protein
VKERKAQQEERIAGRDGWVACQREARGMGRNEIGSAEKKKKKLRGIEAAGVTGSLKLQLAGTPWA